MRRLIYNLIVAAMAFTIGWGSFLIWQKYAAVTICEIENSPEEYVGKTISLRATVHREGNQITAASICHSINAPSAVVELKQGEVKKVNLPETKLLSGDLNNNEYWAEVIITGYLNPTIGPGCFSPKYLISDAKIERVLSINEFENGQQIKAWLESKSR